MIGVFIDTIVICTATAAIILISGELTGSTTAQGIELTQLSLNSLPGSWGGGFITIAILMFAFTSIVSNYYYGESNLRFTINNRWAILLYRLSVLGMVIFSSFASLPTVWNPADSAWT